MGSNTTQCFLATVVLTQNMASSRDILGFQDLEMPLSFGGAGAWSPVRRATVPGQCHNQDLSGKAPVRSHADSGHRGTLFIAYSDLKE